MKKPFDIVIEESGTPIPGNGEALIAVKANGICGSDMHRYTGHSPISNPYNAIGHEYGGIIERIEGEGKGLEPCMKVAVNPNSWCGTCYYCRQSMENLCENMTGFNGMAEKVSVPFKNIVKLDPSFDLVLSPFIEPTACAIHAVGEITSSNVLVIGTGTMGLIEQQILRSNGNNVITIDMQDHALELSRRMGADLAIDFKDSYKEEKLKNYLSHKKIDIVIDNVCSDETVDLAVKAVKKSGTVLIMGVCAKNLTMDYLSVLLKEVVISTNFLFRHKDFVKASELISGGHIDVRPLIAKIYPLKKAGEAFDYKFNSPSAVKVILET